LAHILRLFALVFVFNTFAADISGIWKHADKPAWLNVNMQTGVVTVQRHDNAPGAVGLTVIKELSAAAPIWHGKMYAAEQGDYIAVSLELKDNQTLIVVDSDVVEILRLIRP
jgi:drug/metabolite transporter superfamily protein YnfA